MNDEILLGAGVIVYVGFSVFLVFMFLIPLFIWMRIGKVILLLKEIRDSNDRIADNTMPAGSRPSSKSSAKYVMPE
jgi:hypothetical protein